MPSRLGSKNKKTLAREAEERARDEKFRRQREVSKRRGALAKADSIDRSAPLDSLNVLEEIMRHFYFKARVLESLGDEADWDLIDQAMEQTGKWAKEVAVFRHAKLSAMKLASDPNAPLIPQDMTVEQLRRSILEDLANLSGVLELEAIRLPQGIENRPVVNGDGANE